MVRNGLLNLGRACFTFRVLSFFIFVILLTAFDLAAEPFAAPSETFLTNKLEELLAVPEEEFDLAQTALLISKHAAKDLLGERVNIRPYQKEIDFMAEELRQRTAEEKDPVKRIFILNRYFFGELGFFWNHRDVRTIRNPKYLLLPSVLKQRQGHTLALTILYVSLAERLGLPVYGAAAPGHVFVRYEDRDTVFNIELLERGRLKDDGFYRRNFLASRKSDFYLRRLGKKEVIGMFLSNIGAHYAEADRLDEAIIYLKKSIAINNQHVEAHTNLGNAYLMKGLLDEALAVQQQAVHMDTYHPNAHRNLGFAYAKKGMNQVAIAEYSRALAIDPDNRRSYYHRGLLYHQEGMRAEGSSDFKKLLELRIQGMA